MEEHEPVHAWFELTYAQYLTVPRSILEAMPTEWQRRFVACLEEMGETFDWLPKDGQYFVQMKDGRRRFLSDRLMNYRHPDYEYIESLRQNGRRCPICLGTGESFSPEVVPLVLIRCQDCGGTGQVER